MYYFEDPRSDLKNPLEDLLSQWTPKEEGPHAAWFPAPHGVNVQVAEPKPTHARRKKYGSTPATPTGVRLSGVVVLGKETYDEKAGAWVASDLLKADFAGLVQALSSAPTTNNGAPKKNDWVLVK
jgi:hypothetical protein